MGGKFRKLNEVWFFFLKTTQAHEEPSWCDEHGMNCGISYAIAKQTESIMKYVFGQKELMLHMEQNEIKDIYKQLKLELQETSCC